MARCNIDNIAGAEIMSRFCGYLTPAEEVEILEKFPGLCFYETFGSKNYRDCYCTRCGGSYDVWKSENKEFFRWHHNDQTECPYCGSSVQLKSLGRIKRFSGLDEHTRAAVIRVDQDGNLMISAGIATRQISGYNDLTPYIIWVEKCRYYLSPGKVIGWKRSIDYYFSQMFGPRPWVAMKTLHRPFNTNYFSNSDDLYWLIGLDKLSSSNFKWSQLEEWYHGESGNWLSEGGSPVRLCIEYLAEYAMHPQMEMAVKLGLTQAVTDLCNGRKNHKDLNWKADKPWTFLRLSKQDVKEFLRSASFDLLKWIHTEQKKNPEISVQSMIVLWDTVGGTSAPKLASCALRCEISPKKAARYISSQPGTSRSQVTDLWYDYLDMASKLGYDLSRPDVRMPKDLRERHDAAAQTLLLEENKEAAKKYAKRLKTLRDKYEFDFDGLRIVVPKNAGQIIEEGRTLKHCVGGYAARHINGKAVILFLRHSRRPERSYITLEMCGFDNNDIMQIHGYRNDNYEKCHVNPRLRHAKFLSMWQAWLKAGSKRDGSGKPILPKEKSDVA